MLWAEEFNDIEYLEETGWLLTVKEKAAVDREGNAIPWFTYPAISFLEKRVKEEFRVFEYGCGSSTLWWAKRVSQVCSCDHDIRYYMHIKDKKPENVELVLRDKDCKKLYPNAINEFDGLFDIIVIDGKERIDCAKQAVPKLNPGGVVVWDNTERKKDEEGYNHLIENGFKRIDLEGLGPLKNKAWLTSVFYKADNCLGI